MISSFTLLAAATTALAAPRPVRNPFWPVGHTGTREVITADLEGRGALAVKPAPKTPPPAPKGTAPKTPPPAKIAQPVEKSTPPPPAAATEEEWRTAYRKIQIGGRFAVKASDGRMRRTITLDGKCYGDGDLKSVNSNGRRFTWRVVGLSEGRARLQPENERLLDSGK